MKTLYAMAAAAGLAVAACDNSPSETIEPGSTEAAVGGTPSGAIERATEQQVSEIERRAEAVEEKAEAATGAAEERLENRVDALEKKADAVEAAGNRTAEIVEEAHE